MSGSWWVSERSLDTVDLPRSQWVVRGWPRVVVIGTEWDLPEAIPPVRPITVY